MFTEPVRQLIRQHPKLKQALFTELWTVFEQIPGEFADFLAGTLTGPEQIGQTFFQLLPDNYQKCLGISFFQRQRSTAFYQWQRSNLLF